jgi:DHA2 family multidrug resistance protein
VSGAAGAAATAWKPKSNPWLVAIVVTLGAFMEVLDTTIVNVALPHIAGSLSVSDDQSTWALTTYLVANGIVLTISGSLARRIGRRNYFLICVGVFTLASLGCGMATSFPEILFFRAIQGLFGGGLQPSQQAIILDYFPPEKRGQVFALSAVAIIVAPVVGPLVGGYLTDTYSWHLIFLINVPVGALTLLAAMRTLEDSPSQLAEKRSAPTFDYLGLGFIVLALGCLEVAVDRGENADWLASCFVRGLFIASACGFVFGITWMLRARHPVVDLRVFKDRNFALGTLSIAIMGFVLYASAVLIPQFAQQQLGYTATWAGLVLAPGAVVLIMLIPIAGKLLTVVPVKYVIAASGVALGSALIYSAGLVPELDFKHLAFMRAAQTAGLALLFVPISTIAYATLPPAMNSDAAALFSMARNVCGGIGISVSTALITNHEQTRQSQLVAHLTPTSQPYLRLLQQVEQALHNSGQTIAQAAHNAPGKVYAMLQTQTAVLAYADVFYITAGLGFLLIPTALLMSGIKSAGKAGGE